ncbi:MAG: zinc ribbon domain-containing protein [Thermoleophilia bacterium]
MFCPQCGKQLEEGKGFCKHCGARLSDYAPPAGQAPAAPPPATPPAPPVSGARPIAPPPLPGAREDAPPHVAFPTLPSAAAADPEPPAYAPPAYAPPPVAPPPFPPAATVPPPPPPFAASPAAVPPLPPHPASGERPRWVIPFLAVMGVIIVGSIIGLAIVLASGGGDSPRATGTVATGTTLSITTTISGPPTETTVAGGGVNTTATIPGYDPNSTTVPTSAGGSGTDPAAYVYALDDLESVLYYADSRIPELAKEINARAPEVPTWVSDELQGLSDEILTAQDELAAYDPPADFQRADDLLFQASGEMLYRIDQTYQGIDAMWTAGTVAAGNPYFEEGRKARDAYRKLYDQYRAARPWH